MTVVDLVRLFAEDLDVAVLVTDAQLDRPGPRILYANPGFARMSGYAASELVGLSPRVLQGQGTNREGTRQVQRALRAEGRFVGCLQNYRKGGDAYLCEIDVRAIRRLDGAPEAYIAFEREVVRRRGRPTRGGAGRYRPVAETPAPVFPPDRIPVFD
ncbi:PAS domain S-box-containing protein [Methylobacterium sp. ap11]|uniref:PAS domain-containing protein n=1 Tax=Methylobacterium sp. ap11 TaxID=1761799 RepID=UPI0008CE6D5D|nr:PAS domain-containing protein [Methylobacterium sp. ap11]SEO73596.1 PAS domain S-box-containing protein [Methylobacterium sp. ap11]